MRKRLVSLLLTCCMLLELMSISAGAAKTEVASSPPESEGYLGSLDMASYMAVASLSVKNMLEQVKFRGPKGGCGFAAERGNNLIDRIKGTNAVVIGDTFEKNGADRMILGRDGTEILIQDKYYAPTKRIHSRLLR